MCHYDEYGMEKLLGRGNQDDKHGMQNIKVVVVGTSVERRGLGLSHGGGGGLRSIKRRSIKRTKQPLVLTPSISPPITLANGYAGPHRYTTDVSGLGTVPGIPHTSAYAWKYTPRCVLTSVLEKVEALESTLHPKPPGRNCRTELATI